jgi:predicted AAA+ superfamily ATPase
MTQFKRCLNLLKSIETKSIFLFGPRQVGKTTLLRQTFPTALQINLLRAEQFRALSGHPERLRELVAAHRAALPRSSLAVSIVPVVIDEIQKLPYLLDEVQDLMEAQKDLRFVLTGSSARKLKRSGSNLLGGRARWLQLAPITYPEFVEAKPTVSPLEALVQLGGLPGILNSATPRTDFEDYLGVYLREEIQAEALVRNIEGFSRFFQTAALSNAEQVMYTHVASDAEVPARTVREYFQVLEDTLVGKLLHPFTQTSLRKAVAASKFYFFDVGVANAALGRWELHPGTPEYGKAFEHWVWRELESAIQYLHLDLELSYWRSTSLLEVDFVLTPVHSKFPQFAIEVKAKKVITAKDIKGLLAFAEEFPVTGKRGVLPMRKIVVCLETTRRDTDSGVEVWPVLDFMKAWWGGKL